MCLFFMAMTQLEAVKQLPYLLSNLMAIFTCFPMAIGLLAIGKAFGGIFQNKMLIAIGAISYEIYLVHAFTLNIVSLSAVRIVIFGVITGAFSVIIHKIMSISTDILIK